MIGLDTSILLSYYQAKSGSVVASGGVAAPGSKTGVGGTAAPTAPWSSLSKAPKPDDLLKSVLIGRKFIDEAQTQLDVKGASDDYRQLFTMYQGLALLESLAKRADDDKVSPAELTRIQAAFSRGMAEVSNYVDSTDFEHLRLTYGDAADKAKATVGVPKTTPRYLTDPIHQGTATEAVEAFQGDVRFSMNVALPNKTQKTIDFDLSEMGSLPRSMNNVVKYLNDKIATTTGYWTRFAVEKIPGEEKTVEVNGRTVSLGKAPDQFAIKIQGDTTEILTFSAPATSPAVYITQTAGDPDPKETTTAAKPAASTTSEASETPAEAEEKPTVEQLLKFETGATSDAVRRPGDVNWVDGRVFNVELPEGVSQVRTTVTGPDGSLYMLADVDGEVDGQTIKGSGDVALMKFDSAGNVVYTRTLGASEAASGLALSVGPDGQIAVAGSVTGGFAASGVPIGDTNTIPKVLAADEGADPTKPDSFVAVYNDAGEEMWSQRLGARDDDEATEVAFGADGSVYVLGRTKGAMTGQVSSGSWDSYLRAFDADGRLKSTTQFGAAGEDKPAGLVVNGTNVVVTTIEGGEVKLRNFDLTDPKAPVVTATRNLGSIGGGTIAGVTMDGGSIIIAGSTGATLGIGNTTRASSGSIDTFAARIAFDLSSGGDAIAYYGGAGDDRASAMTVADGKVWITGTTKTALPGMDATLGKTDGFAVGLDIASGAVAWSQRFSGKDGIVNPTSIAVDPGGASALDRLGLPTGKIAYSDSQLVTAATSARPGDQFQIRRRIGGSAVTITIEANDTLQTLATKILRATAYSVKADVVSDGDVRKLQIMPRNSRSSLEILGGKGGLDVLEALGLQEGFVRSMVTDDGVSKPGDGGAAMYGLKMPRDLNLSSEENIKKTLDRLTMAMSVLRTAYRDLEAGMKPAAEKKKVEGEVPAYLKNQLANYQAGLNRLLGGA
ncbi:MULTISPECIES: NHL repeat-containing protein [Phenylobacterium]|uniref:Transcriptional regulator n=1 Tax=Phenylobacterium koreense TaxID=266125 RepID=A0ABV2EJP6_9CAUL